MRLRPHVLWPGLSWEALTESYSQDSSAVTYVCSLEIAGLIERAGDRLIVDLGKIRMDDFKMRGGARESAIHFKYPEYSRSRVELLLPPGYEVETCATGGAIMADFSQFRSRWFADDLKVLLQREFTMQYIFFSPVANDSLRLYFERMYAMDEQPVVLRRVEQN